MLTPALTISLTLVASEPVLEATLTPAPGREVPGFGGVLAYVDPWLVVGWNDPWSFGGRPSRPLHVFLRAGNAWHLDAVIETETAGCREMALATDGARIAISLPGGCTGKRARALVFARGGAADWFLEAELFDPCDSGAHVSDFGSAVALAGERLFVGAPYCTPELSGGNVLAYELASGRWQLRHLLSSEWQHQWQFMLFGSTLALDGSLLAVGSPFMPHTGAASCTVFEFDGDEPRKGRELTRFAPERSHLYARSFAVSGEAVAVSDCALGERGSPCGVVHVYETGDARPAHRPGEGPSSLDEPLGIGERVLVYESGDRPEYQRIDNPAGVPSSFSDPLALGERFLVAGWLDMNGASTWTLSRHDVLVFERDDLGEFVQVARLRPDPSETAAFGHALATRGSRIVIGAPGEAPEDGRVLVYRVD